MNKSHPSKSGAALVISLGFLAVLTIMILMFSAQTRTDRLAGRAYLSTAQTRQLLHTALARAMEDVDRHATSNYPPFNAIYSVESAILMSDAIEFSTEEDYFPRGNSTISRDYSNALHSVEWQTIQDGDANTIGRVGYIIINTSGLLDANSVGGLTADKNVIRRASGISPKEIQLSPDLLPDLNSSGKLILNDGNKSPAVNVAHAFIHNRDTAWKRFESLRDLEQLNNRGRGNAITAPIASFSTFSLYPSNHTTRIDLSSEIDPSNFKAALQTCGLTTDEAATVYENYLDYTDAYNVPRNLLGSSPEAVPMINEIWVENFFFTQDAQDPTNITYDISGDLYVELWYPFEGTSPSPTVQFFAADPAATSTNQFEILEGEENSGASDYVTIDVVYPGSIIKSFILELDDFSTSTDNTKKFTTVACKFYHKETIKLKNPFSDEEAPNPHSILVKQKALEVTDLDRVENTELKFFYEEDGGWLKNQYASCIDPRINHDFTDQKRWISEAISTPNAPNNIDDWGEESDLEDKTSIRFYVRNASMENAAELGYLSTGTPWKTIRLYGENLNPVLDHFRADEPLWNASTRPGLININSQHTNVLATAFFNAPIRIDPENNTPNDRVSIEQSLRIADNLSALTLGEPHRDLSFIGNAISNNIPKWLEWNDAQKESILANSYRLFGWRDTLFTILLVAQSGTDANNDGTISDNEVRGTQKAVVYVWRDPKTGKAAPVFYGLSDTLQSSIGSGQSWAKILSEFRP